MLGYLGGSKDKIIFLPSVVFQLGWRDALWMNENKTIIRLFMGRNKFLMLKINIKISRKIISCFLKDLERCKNFVCLCSRSTKVVIGHSKGKRVMQATWKIKTSTSSTIFLNFSLTHSLHLLSISTSIYYYFSFFTFNYDQLSILSFFIINYLGMWWL